MPLRDGVGFLALDALVSKCVPGTTARDARIRQIVAAHALGGFMQLWDATDRRGDPSPGSNGENVETEFGTFRPAQARFSPSASAVFRGLRMGLLALGAALSATMFPAWRRVSGSHAILIGTSASDCIRDGSDQRFVEFCRYGPVSRLHSPTRLFVQSAHGGIASSDPQIEYSPRPLYGLLRGSDLTALARLRLGVSLIVRATESLLGTCADRRAALLMRDVMESEVVRTLGTAGKLERVIFTNSSVSSQPTWVRSAIVPSSMIWYSENNKWLWDDGAEQRDHPAFRHMDVEEHWVWTAAQRHWLRTKGVLGLVHVVGPILWYLPAETAQDIRDGKLWITLFDITPVSDSQAGKNGLPDSYYTKERCSMFLVGAIEAVRRARSLAGVDIGVRLKDKRPRKDADSGYLSLVRSLARTDQLVLVDWTEDIFALANGSVLCIVQPFSSPALAAASVGARSCYFDAPGVLARPIHLDDGIEFVQSVEQLSECVLKAIGALRSDRFGSGGS
jgi:hypothetical protein